jgi:bacterioferritin-associated ferredoxin
MERDETEEREGSRAESAEPRYICRCEEITEEDIREAIRAGAHSVKEIKRWTRAGMGLCQGRTCRRLVERILMQELGMRPEQVEISSFRQPVRPVSIGAMDNDKA